MDKQGPFRTQMENDEAIAWADKVSDRTGRGLDPLIKEAVAGLYRFDIKTVASCQGHLNRGRPYPWVMIDGSSHHRSRLLLSVCTPETGSFRLYPNASQQTITYKPAVVPQFVTANLLQEWQKEIMTLGKQLLS